MSSRAFTALTGPLALARLLVGLLICLDAGAHEAARIVKSPAFKASELAALPRDGWYTNGGNLLNQRYSPLTQINRTNVSGMKAVWLKPAHAAPSDTPDLAVSDWGELTGYFQGTRA